MNFIDPSQQTERQTMKRLSTILLTVLAIAVALPACSKKNDDAKKKDEHTDHKH